MTPTFDPNEDTKQKDFIPVPIGEQVLNVESVETKRSEKSGNRYYNVVFRTPLLQGDYGNIYCVMLEAKMLHVLLSFCEAAGLSKGHVFPPALRSDPEAMNSFVDIVDGEMQNLLSFNMVDRVVLATIKHETDNKGQLKAVVDINAKPPFRPYVQANGEPYKQPDLKSEIAGHSAEPPVQQQQTTIAPPADDDPIGDPESDILLEE